MFSRLGLCLNILYRFYEQLLQSSLSALRLSQSWKLISTAPPLLNIVKYLLYIIVTHTCHNQPVAGHAGFEALSDPPEVGWSPG